MHIWSFRIQPLTHAKGFRCFWLWPTLGLPDSSGIGQRGDGSLPFRTGSHSTPSCRQAAPVAAQTAQITHPCLAWEEGKCSQCGTWNLGREHSKAANENCPSAASVSAQKPELVPWLHTGGSSLCYPGPDALALGKAVGNTLLSTPGPKSPFDSSHLTYKRSI